MNRIHALERSRIARPGCGHPRGLTLVLVALFAAGNARAQSGPATPVWEATGYGVVRPFHESGFMNREIVLRPADAGGPAEIGLFPWNGFVPRIERWQVTSQGVPFLAGYISTQGNPQKALWTDVDGDGVADLVCIETTASSTFAEVILMKAGGPQAPGRKITIPNTGVVNSLVESDLNGDGRSDVGVIGMSISIWLLGTGADSLALGPQITQSWLAPGSDTLVSMISRLRGPGSATRYVTGRLDLDVRSDLVQWDGPSFAIRFMRGLDDGGFLFTDPTFPGSGPPLFADFDSDGQPDLVSGRYLYRGEASGTPGLLDSLSDPVAAIADVDHDGRLDLVAVATGSIRMAHGRGGFQFDAFTGTPAGAVAPLGLKDNDFGPAIVTGLSAIADVNGDGWLDVVSAGPAAGELDVIPGHGGGTFFSPPRLPTGDDPVQVELADVEGADGRLDLLTLARGARQLELHAGGGDGTFGPVEAIGLPAGAARFALADLDADGWLDVAVACDSSSTLAVFPGGPTGFTARLDLPAAEPLTDVRIADVDEDGLPDLCAATATGLLACWRGLGSMTFAPVGWSSISPGDGRLELTDFDGDGHLDLVTQSPGRTWGSISLTLVRGDGHGTFSNSFQDAPFGSVGQGAAIGVRSPFTVAALSADGRKSIVVAGTDSLVPSLTQCQFNAFQPNPTGEMWGLPDPNGATSFSGYSLPPRPSQVAVADVTGDGIPDGIVLSELYGSLTVLPGLGGIRFGAPISHIVGLAPSSFALGDVDGDGEPDAVVADAGANDVIVLRHRSSQLAAVVPSPAASHLSLRVTSAPGSAQVRVELRLASSAPAVLEAFDTAGRRLGRQRVNAPAGSHALELDSALAPRSGLVFLRLVQGPESATARLVHIR